MLDRPLYLKLYLKKFAIHHILLICQQVITICFQISLKKHLRRFWTNDELKYATEKWLKEWSENFYFTGFEKLQDCYKGGDYIEK